MKKLIFILLLIPHFLFSCLWLEGTTIEGNYRQFEDKTISSLFLKRSQEKSSKEHFKQKFYRKNNQSNLYILQLFFDYITSYIWKKNAL